ncbi:nitrogen regulatory protein P-II family [Gracilibacillus ureilyticus]|uniref:Nitrogen regulatory protein P-II family n=1 Tax=Gracilibacillus ureilyticus TaxID=531814 RepID=A0A1H9Q7T1_9BACI|nr:P-II family nitrogen regulator [Gracilibacillus ureilyticus]SER56487.1 nitrogen regulatory protein P-II family [Gracilibacillus ureilyticus]
MAQVSGIPQFSLIYVIVKFGLGSKIIKEAKKCGISGGTVMLGKGTVHNKILNLLAISDVRKEVVMMIANKKATFSALEHLNKVFHFEKPNHGIAFTTGLTDLVGTRSCTINDQIESEEDKSMFQNIVVIVDKGNAGDVMDAATSAGSKGGTVINARGSGIHETSKLFSMNIEPEKEIVMILADENTTPAIVEKIRQDLKIDDPGNGIIFVQDVNKTYGIYE